MTEATNDASDAFNDMLERLDRLHDDKITLFANEVTLVKAAITRTNVDRKNPCSVLHALRVDFIQNITCDPANLTTQAAWNNDAATNSGQWLIYEGLFDDFHYDIGHGKGTGTGSVDGDRVVDGFGQGSMGGVRGDS